MKSILIFDTVRYKSYNFNTLANEPLGGTEASVLRVAQLLSSNYQVHILNGGEELEQEGVRFITETSEFETPDSIIHIRTAKHVPVMRKAFIGAQQIVWHHDLGGPWVNEELPAMKTCPIDLIFVSDYHKQQWVDRGLPRDYAHSGTMNVIHNPVLLAPDSTQRDPNKLLFASSPHKGLKQTLELFKELKRRNPNLTLYIANPGYYDGERVEQEGVVYLGALPHHEVVAHMRSSALVLSANHVFPETYGLVYAEALAVGTPVITHPLGAMNEILPTWCLVDTRSKRKAIDAVERALKVAPPAKFEQGRVKELWQNVIK